MAAPQLVPEDRTYTVTTEDGREVTIVGFADYERIHNLAETDRELSAATMNLLSMLPADDAINPEMLVDCVLRRLGKAWERAMVTREEMIAEVTAR